MSNVSEIVEKLLVSLQRELISELEAVFPDKKEKLLPRFMNNGDQTVVDNETGLTWIQNGCITFAMSFDEAKVFVEAINSANNGEGTFGRKNWRLPTSKELGTLTTAISGYKFIELSNQGFTNVQACNYWTDGVISSLLSYVWCIDMCQGQLVAIPKSNLCYIWPVCDDRKGA
jgi:hypothetical protein